MLLQMNSADARCKRWSLVEKAAHAENIFLATVVKRSACLSDSQSVENDSDELVRLGGCRTELHLTVEEVFKGDVPGTTIREYDARIVSEHGLRPEQGTKLLIFEDDWGWNNSCGGSSILNERIETMVLPELRAMKSNKSFKQPSAGRDALAGAP